MTDTLELVKEDYQFAHLIMLNEATDMQDILSKARDTYVYPRTENYDETAHSMKFAEMTHDVPIARPTPVNLDVGLMPDRCKANQLYKVALSDIERRYGEVENKKRLIWDSFSVLVRNSPS
ncbi:hypothetical protein pipiens_013756 [Culex pipiens pipiens]|uniref:Uncharacterized protein n=1 Tax=Culex pipiens pipiens TaxID=38569 RepID=A0ABD1CX60_CULPP